MGFCDIPYSGQKRADKNHRKGIVPADPILL